MGVKLQNLVRVWWASDDLTTPKIVIRDIDKERQEEIESEDRPSCISQGRMWAEADRGQAWMLKVTSWMDDLATIFTDFSGLEDLQLDWKSTCYTYLLGIFLSNCGIMANSRG